MIRSIFWDTVNLGFMCLERFLLPLGAWDGLRYFIVALPEPSYNYLELIFTDEKKIPDAHDFTETEVEQIRENLLLWYRKNKRDLPWRNQVLK